MIEINKSFIPLKDYPHISYRATSEEAFALVKYPQKSRYLTVFIVFD